MVLALLDKSDLCLSNSTIEAIVANVIDILYYSSSAYLQDLIFILTCICAALFGLQTFSQVD